MISALCFIPAGRADPTPKKYELSTGEQGMLGSLAASSTGEADPLPPPPPTKSDSKPNGNDVNMLDDDGNDLPDDLR